VGSAALAFWVEAGRQDSILWQLTPSFAHRLWFMIMAPFAREKKSYWNPDTFLTRVVIPKVLPEDF
jgi:hypothetical protein